MVQHQVNFFQKRELNLRIFCIQLISAIIPPFNIGIFSTMIVKNYLYAPGLDTHFLVPYRCKMYGRSSRQSQPRVVKCHIAISWGEIL